MATYAVNSDQIAASSAHVVATGERIRGEVATMMAELAALQDTWGGVASAGFVECATQWRATQAQVEAALDTIGAQLAHAATVYADAEARSTAIFVGG